MQHNRGIIVTGNALIAGVFFLLVGVFGFNFFADTEATTTISIEPRNETFSVDEIVPVDVFVTSRTPLNALDATILFPPEQLEVVDVSFEDSIIDVWITQPVYSNTEGEVVFTGGSTRPGGVVGKSPIITIFFKPRQSGSVTLDFSHSLILAHDGVGTDLEERNIDARVLVEELRDEENPNVIRKVSQREYIITDPLPKIDLDSDGKNSLSDLSVFLTNYAGPYDEHYDFNRDGSINIKDASIILSKILIKK